MKKTVTCSPIAPDKQAGRTFLVHFTSDEHGYAAEVVELMAGGGSRPIFAEHGPRCEISAPGFFRMRKHYRGMLHAEILAELRNGVVRPATDPVEAVCYIRANLRSLPKGLTATDFDDLSDWTDSNA